MATVSPISARKTGDLARLLEERGYGNPDFQLLVENPADVTALIDTIKARNPFEKEFVQQAWFYPQGWVMPGVSDQAERLTAIFPGIKLDGVAEIAGKLAIPEGFDGIGIVPKISYLGGIYSVDDPYGQGYGTILENVLKLIADSRKFYNYRAGQLTADYIRIHAEVKEVLMRLEAETAGDTLVVPISFGNLYAGFSQRNARWAALKAAQVPFGGAQVGSLLLSMPERLTAYEQLFIDCSGDEYNWDADGQWAHSVYFNFNDDKLKFDADDAGNADDYYGSVVGSLGVQK